jgi:hypothetical protein
MKSIVKTEKTYGVMEMTEFEARCLVAVLGQALYDDINSRGRAVAGKRLTSEQTTAVNAFLGVLQSELELDDGDEEDD